MAKIFIVTEPTTVFGTSPCDISKYKYITADIPVVEYTGQVKDFPGAAEYLSSFFPLVYDDNGEEVICTGFISIKENQSISSLTDFIWIRYSSSTSFNYYVVVDGVWGDNATTMYTHPWTILWSIANECYGYIATNNSGNSWDDPWGAGLFQKGFNSGIYVKNIYDFIEAYQEPVDFDLKSWLTGFALGLAGKPLPFSLVEPDAPVEEPVAYLYNGVRLIPLPEWDKDAYPYAVIDKAIMSSYRLHLFDHLPHAENTENGYTRYGPMDGSVYIYKGVAKEGSESGWSMNAAYEDIDGITTSKVLWTNFDLLYADGKVCCAKSDPVPVYE